MSLENIDAGVIGIAILIVLAIVVIVCIAKKLLKMAIIVGVVLVLFNIVFVLNGSEIREKFKLDQILSEEKAGIIEVLFNDFAKRRDELAVVNTKKIYDEMVDAASEGAVIVVDGAKKIYTDVFAKNINKIIKEYKESGKEVNMETLKQSIKEAFPGISDADIGEIIKKAFSNDSLDNSK